MEYKSEEELFNSLRGAFNVKLRMINEEYNYIKMVDIWNYLKINKWIKTKNLSISEMVNDIIDVDINKVDLFLKEHIKKEERFIIHTEEYQMSRLQQWIIKHVKSKEVIEKINRLFIGIKMKKICLLVVKKT